MSHTIQRKHQQGVFLLEALIGIVIFSIGLLTMIALQAKAISVQSDAQYRIEAANLVDRMLGTIALNVDRSTAATLQSSLDAFRNNPDTAASCSFNGGESTNADVLAWGAALDATLPGTSSAMRQIQVTNTSAAFNQVVITVCWKSPADPVPRQHTVVSYIN